MGKGDAVDTVEAFLDGVQGAGADVAIHHPQGAQGQDQGSLGIFAVGRWVAGIV